MRVKRAKNITILTLGVFMVALFAVLYFLNPGGWADGTSLFSLSFGASGFLFVYYKDLKGKNHSAPDELQEIDEISRRYWSLFVAVLLAALPFTPTGRSRLGNISTPPSNPSLGIKLMIFSLIPLALALWSSWAAIKQELTPQRRPPTSRR
jgi:hypothetical protein